MWFRCSQGRNLRNYLISSMACGGTVNGTEMEPAPTERVVPSVPG